MFFSTRISCPPGLDKPKKVLNTIGHWCLRASTYNFGQRSQKTNKTQLVSDVFISPDRPKKWWNLKLELNTTINVNTSLPGLVFSHWKRRIYETQYEVILVHALKYKLALRYSWTFPKLCTTSIEVVLISSYLFYLYFFYRSRSFSSLFVGSKWYKKFISVSWLSNSFFLRKMIKSDNLSDEKNSSFSLQNCENLSNWSVFKIIILF